MPQVYFYEVFAEEEEALRHYLPSSIRAEFTGNTIQANVDNRIPAPMISVRTQSIIPIDWTCQLQAILTRSTGYDHLTRYLDSCRREIPCGYLPLYCNRAVAEQAMLLWMALLRKLPQQQSLFASFNRDGLTGRECYRKVLLVVGVGNIGYEVVKIGKGLSMDVLGVDIVKRYPSVTYVDIEEGIALADIIVVAMNLTTENVGYFHYDLLKKARPGFIFINIARGELCPAVDLLKLIQEKHMGGLALDVYKCENRLAVAMRTSNGDTDENIRAILALSEHCNVILTPHNAFNTMESVARKASQTVEQVVKFLETGCFLWPIPSKPNPT